MSNAAITTQCYNLFLVHFAIQSAPLHHPLIFNKRPHQLLRHTTDITFVILIHPPSSFDRKPGIHTHILQPRRNHGFRSKSRAAIARWFHLVVHGDLSSATSPDTGASQSTGTMLHAVISIFIILILIVVNDARASDGI